MENERIKHLEFIQNIITRMNHDSFQIKNWSIVILAALITVYATTGSYIPLALAIITSLLFWIFDTYYLYQETVFRDMYKEAAKKDNSQLPVWELNPHCNKFTRTKTFWQVLWSKTECGLYLPLIIITVVLMLLVIYEVIFVNVVSTGSI